MPSPARPRRSSSPGGRRCRSADDALLDEVAAVRRLVELGRQARAASKLRTRQPLRRLVAEGLDAAAGHADEIADELRVKEVVFGPVEATELQVRPNLKVLGPRLGAELGKLRAALDGGRVRGPARRRRSAWPATTSDADDVLVERTEKEGWAVAASDGATVAFDIDLDDELRLEGRVYDMIHRVNTLRKEQGLALTDRIDLLLPVVRRRPARARRLDRLGDARGQRRPSPITTSSTSRRLALTASRRWAL